MNTRLLRCFPLFVVCLGALPTLAQTATPTPGGHIEVDWDIVGPESRTSQCRRGHVGTNYTRQDISGASCNTDNSRTLYTACTGCSPHWARCTYRLVWDPVDTSGGIELLYGENGFAKPVVISELAGLPAGMRTTTVDITRTMNALADGRASGNNIWIETKGNGIYLCQVRVYCTTTVQNAYVPPPTPTIASGPCGGCKEHAPDR